MSDYFRILRGLEIDESARIIAGSGVPGSTPDTDAAPVGTLYLDTANGNAWSKVLPGSSFDKWNGVSMTLFSESPSSPSLPVAGAPNSIALGPAAQVSPGADNAIAIGSQAVARHQGALVVANGRFASSGDMQSGKYILRTHTVTGSATELFLDGTGGSRRLVLPDDATWTFKATVTAHRTDDDDGHAGYSFTGVVYRRAGAATVAFQGAPVKTVIAESNPEWDINITANTTHGSLSFLAVGQSGKVIRWGVVVETVEITN